MSQPVNNASKPWKPSKLNKMLGALWCGALLRKGPMCCTTNCSCFNDVESPEAQRARADEARWNYRSEKLADRKEARAEAAERRAKRQESKSNRRAAKSEKKKEIKEAKIAKRQNSTNQSQSQTPTTTNIQENSNEISEKTPAATSTMVSPASTKVPSSDGSLKRELPEIQNDQEQEQQNELQSDPIIQTEAVYKSNKDQSSSIKRDRKQAHKDAKKERRSKRKEVRAKRKDEKKTSRSDKDVI